MHVENEPKKNTEARIVDAESSIVSKINTDVHVQLSDEMLEAGVHELFRKDRDAYHADEEISDEQLRGFTRMQFNFWDC